MRDDCTPSPTPPPQLPSTSLYQTALREELDRQLEGYRRALVRVEAEVAAFPRLPLTHLRARLLHFAPVFDAVLAVVVDVTGGGLVGGRLLNRLHAAAQSGFPSVQVCGGGGGGGAGRCVCGRGREVGGCLRLPRFPSSCPSCTPAHPSCWWPCPHGCPLLLAQATFQALLHRCHEVLFNQLIAWTVYGLLPEGSDEFFIAADPASAKAALGASQRGRPRTAPASASAGSMVRACVLRACTCMARVVVHRVLMFPRPIVCWPAHFAAWQPFPTPPCIPTAPTPTPTPPRLSVRFQGGTAAGAGRDATSALTEFTHALDELSSGFTVNMAMLPSRYIPLRVAECVLFVGRAVRLLTQQRFDVTAPRAPPAGDGTGVSGGAGVGGGAWGLGRAGTASLADSSSPGGGPWGSGSGSGAGSGAGRGLGWSWAEVSGWGVCVLGCMCAGVCWASGAHVSMRAHAHVCVCVPVATQACVTAGSSGRPAVRRVFFSLRPYSAVRARYLCPRGECRQ